MRQDPERLLVCADKWPNSSTRVLSAYSGSHVGNIVAVNHSDAEEFIHLPTPLFLFLNLEAGVDMLQIIDCLTLI